MRRARNALGERVLVGKIAGVALAVSGAVIIIAKVPSAFWWFLLGAVLILLGWKLFTC